MTAYDAWLGGTASALGPVSFVDSSGEASASSSAVHPIATTSGRRITAFASRYQAPEASETAGPRRIERALMRVPSSASSAGTTSSVMSAERIPTAAPAAPIEYRKRWGMRTSATSATATVRPENRTVRPAVSTVRRCASNVAPPSRSSSSR